MKKIIYILAGIALTATLMVGCSSSTKDTQNKQDTQSASTNSSTSTDDSSNKQNGMQKADLEGEVTSISGNKVTIKVIKTPEKTEGAAPDNASKDSDKANANKDSDKANSKDGQLSKGQPNKQVEYTGETKDITISDGAKIETMSMDQGNPSQKEITASDIKAGDVLRITYSDKEKETISTINVMSATNKDSGTSNK